MLFLILPLLPSAQALTPSARWGHRAVYIEDKQSVYVVGGSTSSDGTQITNDVLVLPLDSAAPSWAYGPSSGLPAHAFASLAQSGSNLVVVGGMTASCANDGVAHSLNLGGGGSSWSSATPSSLKRRHGAVAAGVNDKVFVVGGLSDKKTCGTSTAAYAAVDEVSVPVSTSSKVNTVSLPRSLTGTQLAVADFALAQTNDKLYLAGGQTADGTLVNYNQIGVWSEGKGWTSQTVKGDVPAGRLGATLVAHPTLDVLILHGGSEYDSKAQKYSPSPVLATLNTTSWEWSKPSNLQKSSAVAYHTSVMTPSGVMISAFGMGSQGSPVGDVAYLDMRESSADSWAWTSKWDKSMLDVNTPSAPQEGVKHSSSDKGKIAAAVVPTVIGLLILVPLCLVLWRRHQRNVRKRRLASHYSFSAQEDGGDFTRGLNPFNQNRRTQTVYPFGRDANEKEGTWTSDMRNRIVRVFRRGSSAHGVGDDGTIASRDMTQVSPSELQEKGMNWEEIDFGLGRVDENRREATYTDLPARRGAPRSSMPRRDSFNGAAEPMTFPMPIASTMYAEEIEGDGVATGDLVSIDSHGSPRNDGQSPLASVPETPLAQPAATSGIAAAAADAANADAQAADWEALEKSLSSKPAFRSISPTSTLQSHSHQQDTPNSPTRSNGSHNSSASYTTAPSLPPLDFATTVNKRSSVVAVPGVRSVSGPRQLTGRKAVPNDKSNSTHARRASASSLAGNRLSGMQRLHVVNSDGENN